MVDASTGSDEIYYDIILHCQPFAIAAVVTENLRTSKFSRLRVLISMESVGRASARTMELRYRDQLQLKQVHTDPIQTRKGWTLLCRRERSYLSAERYLWRCSDGIQACTLSHIFPVQIGLEDACQIQSLLVCGLQIKTQLCS